MLIPRPLALAIVCLVSLVWAGNWALVALSSLQLLGVEYQSDVALNGIFMVVVGGALIASRRRVDPDADDGTDLPDNVVPPSGLEQARRAAAAWLDPGRDAAPDPPPRHGRHGRGDP